MIDKNNQPLFSYNDLERRFNQLSHRIHYSLLFKERFLEPFKEEANAFDDLAPLKRPTFSEFQQSRKKVKTIDFCKEQGIHPNSFESEELYVYEGHVQIEIIEPEIFLLTILRETFVAKNLEELINLEQILYEFCTEEGIFE